MAEHCAPYNPGACSECERTGPKTVCYQCHAGLKAKHEILRRAATKAHSLLESGGNVGLLPDTFIYTQKELMTCAAELEEAL